MVEGIQQEMERDPRVICMGEDVGKMGGVFQSTAGLQEVPGPCHRHADFRNSDHGRGARRGRVGPAADRRLMFVDFMGVCFGQIMNEIGKATYMSVARCACRW